MKKKHDLYEKTNPDFLFDAQFQVTCLFHMTKIPAVSIIVSSSIILLFKLMIVNLPSCIKIIITACYFSHTSVTSMLVALSIHD